MLIVDVSILQIVYAVVMPLLVGLVTKKLASSKIKSVVLIALSAVGALVATAITGGGIFTDQMLTEAVINFIIATATYYGVWKPTGVAEKVQDKTPEIGIG